MNDFTAAIIGIGILICVNIFWTLTDPRSLKEIVNFYFMPRTILREIIDISIAILLVIQVIYFPLIHTSFDTVINFAGLIILVIGVLITIYSKIILGKSWGPCEIAHDKKRQSKLITQGIYKYSRNPIYLGFILSYFGLFIATRSYLVIFAILATIKLHKIAIREESILQKTFGKEYLSYKNKTPRYL